MANQLIDPETEGDSRQRQNPGPYGYGDPQQAGTTDMSGAEAAFKQPSAGQAPTSPSMPADGTNRVYDDKFDPQKTPLGDPSDPRGGDPNDVKSGLRDAEQGGDERGLYNPDDEGSNSKTASPDDLKKSEQQAADDNDGGYASDEFDNENRRRRMMASAKKNKSKFALFAFGAGGGIFTLIFAVFMMIPLKIEHMIQNVQDRVMAVPQAALEKASMKVARQYVVKYVIPDYKNCGTTRDRRCKVRISSAPGNNVRQLYQAWSYNRLENKLYTKYGIEFKIDTVSGRTWMIYPGGPKNGVDIGVKGAKFEQELENRKQAKKAFASAIKLQTKWPKLWLRYKVGPLMKNKYAIHRCVFFCGIRGAIDDRKEAIANAGKLVIANYAIKPRNEATFIAISCLLDTECQPQTQVEPDLCDGSDPDCVPGPSESDIEHNIKTTLSEKAVQFGVPGANIEEATKTFKEMSERGLQRYMTDQVLQKVFRTAQEETIKKMTDRIPYIGWIDLAAQFVSYAHDAAPKIKKLAFLMAAPAAVGIYYAYTSGGDELHTHNVNAEEFGDLTATLGKGTVDEYGNAPMGGTASAEEAPLWDDINDNPVGTPTSSVASLLTDGLVPKASADSPLWPNYICNNDKPVSEGSRTCTEELFSFLGGAATAPTTVVDSIPGVVAAADAWNSSLGVAVRALQSVGDWILSPALATLQKGMDVYCGAPKINIPFAPDIRLAPPIPGADAYCKVKDVVGEMAPKLVEAFSNLHDTFSPNMGGGRVLHNIIAGGQITSNATCDEQLGCATTDDTKPTADALQVLADEKREEFASQPFLKRMFDTESSSSLISKTAMMVPFDRQAAMQSGLSSTLLNPFGSLFKGFGAMFSSGKASAVDDNRASLDRFGLGMRRAPEISDDAEGQWEQRRCSDNTENGPIAQWQKRAADRAKNDQLDSTGMPIHTDTEPCLLLRTFVATAGGLFDKGLLDKQDLGEVADSSPEPTSSATSSFDLADIYKDSTDIKCAEGTKDVGVQDGYSGGKKIKIRVCAVNDLPSSSEDSMPGNSLYIEGANGKALVNSRVSGAIVNLVAAAKKAGIPMAANSSFRSMEHQEQLCNSSCRAGNNIAVAKPGYSNHQMGIAIDFAMANGQKFPLGREYCVNVKGVCSAPGDKVWEWLKSNAKDYGFKQYVNEFWHFSPNGK